MPWIENKANGTALIVRWRDGDGKKPSGSQLRNVGSGVLDGRKGPPVVAIGQRRTLEETRAPYLSGEDPLTGHRLHPAPFAGPSEGLIPRAGSALDLAHVGPKRSGATRIEQGDHT
jgi:hypothetical protein